MTKVGKGIRIGIITGIGISVIGVVIAHGGIIRIRILVLVHIVITAITMRAGMIIAGRLADHRTNGVIILRIFALLGHDRSSNF